MIGLVLPKVKNKPKNNMDELEKQLCLANPQRPGEKLEVYQRRISDLIVAQRKKIERDRKAEQKSESARRGGKKAKENPNARAGVKPAPHVGEDPATIPFLDNPRLADAGILHQRQRTNRRSRPE